MPFIGVRWHSHRSKIGGLAAALLYATALLGADGDARSVETYRAGLASAVAEMRVLPPGDSRQMLSAGEKERVRQTWSSFLDYLLALDSIGAYHRTRKGEPALVLTYAAFLAQYRYAMEMIDAAQQLPGADAVLNESLPALGLTSGSFARVKFRYLNVARATEYAALESLYRLKRGNSYPRLRAAIDEDSRAVLRMGRGQGPKQTAANALKIAGGTAFTAWFPVQKGVAEWMGDTRVARADRFLITHAQIASFAPRLEPGDVFLERREWYLSNVGLPGFWPHAALYVGDASSRARYFADDDVRAWVREQGRPDGDFEAFLRERHASRYAKATPVIEAVSEGVSFTTLEHSASADSLAVLRPRTTKRAKAIAIARAFGYVGLPYDFNFDHHTDSAMVCSEVVFKAYEGHVTLPVASVMGHLTTPPNDIVREFDATYGSPRQQFDLVLFLDGHERKHATFPAGVDAFRASWTWPKWHVVTQ